MSAPSILDRIAARRRRDVAAARAARPAAGLAAARDALDARLGPPLDLYACLADGGRAAANTGRRSGVSHHGE